MDFLIPYKPVLEYFNGKMISSKGIPASTL